MNAEGSKHSVRVWKHHLHSKGFYCHDFKTKDTQLFLKHFPRWSFHPLEKESKYFLNPRPSQSKSASSKVPLQKTLLCWMQNKGSSIKVCMEEKSVRISIQKQKGRKGAKSMSKEMNWVQGKAPRCTLEMQKQPICSHIMSLKMIYLRRKANCRNPTVTQGNWYSGKQRKLNWKGQSYNALGFLYYTGWPFLCNLHQSSKKR